MNPLRVNEWAATTPSGPEFGLLFGARGKLLQANVGLNRSDDIGFTVCTVCREWNPGNEHYSAGKDCGDEIDNKIAAIAIHTEADHDMVVINATPSIGTDADTFAYSLMYSLTAGISVLFGIDESELDGRVFPDPTSALGRKILIFELDEGGIGVLTRLQDEWEAVCNRALEIVHVDPGSGTTAADACDTSCYECLRSFYNQFHHDYLDRKVAVDWLLAARRATFIPVAFTHDWESVLAIFDGLPVYASGEEARMVEQIRTAGLPAPSKAHLPVPSDAPVAEADLFYHVEGVNVAVFLHGSVHDRPTVAAADADKRSTLKSMGWRVVEIWHDDVEGGIAKLQSALTS